MRFGKNDTVSTIDEKILSMFEAEKKTYISVDIFTNHDQAVGTLFKFFNSLNLLGFPLHKFDLKIDAFIINMRNLNAYK